MEHLGVVSRDLNRELRILVVIQSVLLAVAMICIAALVNYYDSKLLVMQKQLQQQQQQIQLIETQELPQLAYETRSVLKKYEQIYTGILQGIKEEW